VTDCAKCGACTVVCPLYQVTGQEFLTARGKIHLLERLVVADGSGALGEILSRCLLCGACTAACPRGLDIVDRIARARGELPSPPGRHPFLALLARKTLSHPPLLAGLAHLGRALPADSGLRLRLGIAPAKKGAPSDPNRPTSAGQATVAYFSGCLARHLDPQIATATGRLAARASGHAPWTPPGQTCCGQAAWAAGDFQTAKTLARRNIAAFLDNDLPILTSCASCHSHLATYPALLADDSQWHERAVAFSDRLYEFSSFLTACPDFATWFHRQADTPRQAVLYHDPCHLRFGQQITEPPRRLLRSIDGLALRELPHGPQCCGMGGLFHLAHPDLSQAIRTRLLDDFATLGIALVTTTCTGCLLQWRQGLSHWRQKTSVRHLAVLLDQWLLPATTPRPGE